MTEPTAADRAAALLMPASCGCITEPLCIQHKWVAAALAAVRAELQARVAALEAERAQACARVVELELHLDRYTDPKRWP